MTEITRSIKIDASPQHAWSCLYPQNWLKIFDFVRNVEDYHEESHGVGTHAKVVAQIDDEASIRYNVEITEFVEEKRIVYKRYGGPLSGTGVLQLRPLKTGVLLRRKNYYQEDLSEDTIEAISAGMEKENLGLKKLIEEGEERIDEQAKPQQRSPIKSDKMKANIVERAKVLLATSSVEGNSLIPIAVSSLSKVADVEMQDRSWTIRLRKSRSPFEKLSNYDFVVVLLQDAISIMEMRHFLITLDNLSSLFGKERICVIFDKAIKRSSVLNKVERIEKFPFSSRSSQSIVEQIDSILEQIVEKIEEQGKRPPKTYKKKIEDKANLDSLTDPLDEDDEYSDRKILENIIRNYKELSTGSNSEELTRLLKRTSRLFMRRPKLLGHTLSSLQTFLTTAPQPFSTKRQLQQKAVPSSSSKITNFVFASNFVLDDGLTLQNLLTHIIPYLASISELQGIINSVYGVKKDILIRSISNYSPIEASLEEVAKAAQITEDTITPWKNKHGKEIAQVARNDKEVAIRKTKSESLEIEAQMAINQAEEQKLLAEAARERAEAEKLELNNQRLRLKLQKEKYDLAFEILKQIDPNMAPDKKQTLLSEIIAVLDKQVNSRVEISVVP